MAREERTGAHRCRRNSWSFQTSSISISGLRINGGEKSQLKFQVYTYRFKGMQYLLVLCVFLATALLRLQPTGGQRGAYRSTLVPLKQLLFPDLPYGYDELEPFLDAATLKVHHQGHHKAYTRKTNTALDKWREQVRMCVCLSDLC